MPTISDEMLDDLVKELLDCARLMDGSEERALTNGILLIKAADAIEAQQVRMAQLEAALDAGDKNASLSNNGSMWRFWAEKAQVVADKNVALRAQLATARRAALEDAAKYHGNFLMTKTSLPVETIVDSEEAIRALAEKE